MTNLPVIDMVRTGQNIASLRKDAGLSVKALQDIFGFATPQAIYKWQHGTAMPSIDNLVVLAAVFGVTMDKIIVTNEAALQSVAILSNTAATQNTAVLQSKVALQGAAMLKNAVAVQISA